MESNEELVFRKNALSIKNKFLLIVLTNILLFAVLILAVQNLDYLLFDQVTGEPRHRSGRILGFLVMGLPIMVITSILIGIGQDKSIHVTKEGLAFNQPNPFSKPIPWSQFKSVEYDLQKTLIFKMYSPSEYTDFSIKLRDYKISKSDVPKLIEAVNYNILRANTNFS